MNRSTQLNLKSGSGGYRGNTINQRSNMTDSEQTNEYCENNQPSTSNPQNQPTYADGYTKIPPNELRRIENQRIRLNMGFSISGDMIKDLSSPSQLMFDADVIFSSRWATSQNTEVAVLRRPYTVRIRTVGTTAKCHEYKETRREEENTDLLKKKEEQRRKADILEEKQKQQEEDRKRQTEADHRRVNTAFLDRLQASSSGRVPEPVTQTAESTNVWLDSDDDDVDDDEPQDTALSNPSQVHADRAEEDDSDHTWTLMKLQNRFPYYEQDMLEEIVKQCNGNYQQAYELLDV
ncbi:uncharacterized protein epsti1 [Garra rufa]|uniref:uncharacterized protein epsti1 n=1 Tax=Garra rufa TaxID=137080 RepID=UPI003CCEAB7B